MPVFTPEKVEEQIEQTCASFLKSALNIDTQKKIIYLPKVCEVYKKDFGDGIALHCLYFCVRFLEKDMQETILEMIHDANGGYILKYQASSETFHASLNFMHLTDASS